jgi:hypothetical protein
MGGVFGGYDVHPTPSQHTNSIAPVFIAALDAAIADDVTAPAAPLLDAVP